MFDKEGYEDVNFRIHKIRNAHISGRVITEIIDFDFKEGFVLFKASIYREYEDVHPAATGFAFEVRSDRGVNRDFWIENAETSAIGRAIGLLMPSEKRPTKQDMEKVERLSHVPASPDPWGTFTVTTTEIPEPVGNVLQLVQNELGGEIIGEVPLCAHGRMNNKQGKKDGRAYSGYTCPAKVRADQCEARWDAIARLENSGGSF